MDLYSIFSSEYYGNRWSNGSITWSAPELGIRAPTAVEMDLLRRAFKLWDDALESVTFQEVSPNDGGVQIQVGLGETNGLSGYWSATWSTVRTSASITLAPDLDPALFAVAAAHEIANVLGLGDIDGGGYVESLTSDPFSSFHLSNPNLNYLSRIDFELVNQLYGEDSADYLGYLAGLSIFSQVMVGDSNAALAESFSGSDRADLVFGFGGADGIEGEGGADYLVGGSGGDAVRGGAGGDTIYGGSGSDNLYGDDGSETLVGGAGSDVVYGGNGADTGLLGAGEDEFYGGAGSDLVTGGGGDDFLVGGGGDDDIFGGLGNDVLFGGPGNNVLNGESGSDTFVLYRGDPDGFDFLPDYEQGVDQLFLEGGFSNVMSEVIDGSTYLSEFGDLLAIIPGVDTFI